MRKLQEKARGRQPFSYGGRVIYEWEQGLDEVHIYLQPPPWVSKKDLDIKIDPKRIRLGLRNAPPLMDEELFAPCDRSESYWMLEDGELHIQLTKMRKGEAWTCAVRGHGALDPFCAQEVQKKLMLERFQEEHPGFDFSQVWLTELLFGVWFYLDGIWV